MLESLWQVRAGGDPELLVDVLEVVLHRPDGDAELRRDLLVGAARGGQQGGLPLGLGEA